jgi:hypothetical protein
MPVELALSPERREDDRHPALMPASTKLSMA